MRRTQGAPHAADRTAVPLIASTNYGVKRAYELQGRRHRAAAAAAADGTWRQETEPISIFPKPRWSHRVPGPSKHGNYYLVNGAPGRPAGCHTGEFMACLLWTKPGVLTITLRRPRLHAFLRSCSTCLGLGTKQSPGWVNE